MRQFVRLFLALLLAAGCSDAVPAHEQSHVDRAKAVDVAALDASLGSQRLEDWLQSVARDRSIQWSSVDCDGRRCARFDVGDAERPSATAVLEVDPRPRLLELEVPPFTGDATPLSALPDLLERGEKTVAFAKALDVRTLDPALPSQPLDEWLRRGPMELREIDWRVSDCNMKPIDDDRDRYPLCVDFVFERGAVRGLGIVRVGTLGGGPAQPASLVHVLLTAKRAGTESHVTSKLAELPALVAKYQ
ncbi:MAG TPA: hypothetical protein VNI54_16225 [Thermoanaerobaculia bacterium]|nr:hypothetical protein [Thermoanaerobaculia bacterium]